MSKNFKNLVNYIERSLRRQARQTSCGKAADEEGLSHNYHRGKKEGGVIPVKTGIHLFVISS
jgi:hypothetical protein